MSHSFDSVTTMCLTRPALFGVLIFAMGAGCPRRASLRAAPALSSTDPSASEAFARARRLFEEGTLDRADHSFREILKRYPTDLLAAHAVIFRGRIAIAAGHLAKARDLLAPIANQVPLSAATRQARYHLGLVQVRRGAYSHGTKLLHPFLNIADKDARPSVLAALALAARESKDYVTAVSHFSLLYNVSDRPTEKIWAREQLENLVAERLPLKALEQVFVRARLDSLLVALIGRRLEALAIRNGDEKAAVRARDKSATARKKHNVEREEEVNTQGMGGAVGLLLPYSGPYRSVRRQLLVGALAASDALSKETSAGNLSLVVRDDHLASINDTVEKLILEERVVALVGAIDPLVSRRVARIAAKHGTPYISLSPAHQTVDASTFRIIPTSQARATALADYVARAGLRRAAVLHPNTAYGKSMATFFSSAHRTRGGVIVSSTAYETDRTSFTRIATEIARDKLQAIFVPDGGKRLALIAPALAYAGLWPARTDSTPAGGRTIQLLATADGIDASIVQSAARYLQAAVICPGFFPDPHDQRTGSLVKAFATRFGHPPRLIEALAYDAVGVIRSQVEKGAQGRTALVRSIRQATIAGLTGEIRFDVTGSRKDRPLLYRIQGHQVLRLAP
jgi:branched-chain amino acid transport system substrate-binding protein